MKRLSQLKKTVILSNMNFNMLCIVTAFVLIIGCTNAIPFGINNSTVQKIESDIITSTGSNNIYKSSSKNFKCHVCMIVTWILQQTLHLREPQFASEVDKVCKVLHIEAADICDGIVKVFKNEVLTVIDGMFLDPDEVCSFLLGPSCGQFYDPFNMWNISLPNRPRYNNKQETKHNRKGSTLRVLHLADVHIDSKYKVNSRMNCDRPLCCRNASGPNTRISARAGYWGSYGQCDLPIHTLEHLFKSLNQSDKFDYILWTGDLISHDDWDQTREEQLHLIDYLADLFISYFPNTPVYWSLGNHESVPVNSFPPAYITGEESMSWLYPHLAKVWSHWLPNTTSYDIRRGGFYTVKLQPGYRLVSLNMNYCNTQNWWMLINTTDPTGELEWLVSVLYEAETTNDKVHIIGHIAPGSGDCMKAWSWNYYKIINRFSSTITGQFFGHSHTDSFEIFYDISHLRKPLSVAYVAPSVTTFIGMNPAYRVYTVDGFHKGSSWSVLDHETYIMNLTEANDFGRPTWSTEYSAKAAYNLKDLTPKSWHQLTEEFLHNEEKIEKYYRYFYKSSPRHKQCDKQCIRNLVCDMRSGRSHDNTFCQDFGVQEIDYRQWLIKNKMC